MAQLIFKGRDLAIQYGIPILPVGRIRQDTLYLDSPSKHKSTNSYGIDLLLVKMPEMGYFYKYITLTIGREQYTTTLLFWRDHGKVIDLNNGREESFLPLPLININTASKYTEYIRIKEFADKDIFDVALESNGDWTFFEEWEVAQLIKDEYKASLKFKVQL